MKQRIKAGTLSLPVGPKNEAIGVIDGIQVAFHVVGYDGLPRRLEV
jgi:hypothetical protein